LFHAVRVGQRRLLTDGLAFFNGFEEAGSNRVVKNTGSGRPLGGDYK